MHSGKMPLCLLPQMLPPIDSVRYRQPLWVHRSVIINATTKLGDRLQNCGIVFNLSFVFKYLYRRKQPQKKKVAIKFFKHVESIDLEANSKGNEVRGFGFEGGRGYVVRGALRPNYGSFSSPIPPHEYITLILWYVHLFSSHDQN